MRLQDGERLPVNVVDRGGKEQQRADGPAKVRNAEPGSWARKWGRSVSRFRHGLGIAASLGTAFRKFDYLLAPPHPPAPLPQGGEGPGGEGARITPIQKRHHNYKRLY